MLFYDLCDKTNLEPLPSSFPDRGLGTSLGIPEDDAVSRSGCPALNLQESFTEDDFSIRHGQHLLSS